MEERNRCVDTEKGERTSVVTVGTPLCALSSTKGRQHAHKDIVLDKLP